MTVASSSERLIDDSVKGDFARSRESGIVDRAGGSPHASSPVASSPVASSPVASSPVASSPVPAGQLGAGVTREDRAERRLGTQPIDTETVKTMTADLVSSNEVSVTRAPGARNPGYPGAVDQPPADREPLEREASPAVPSGASVDEDIDIATDDAMGPSGARAEAATSSGDDEAIEVSDDEIETAEPAPSGHMLLSGRTLQSPAVSIAPPSSAPYSSSGVARSRPPAPPSSRPRMPMPSLSGVSLPRPMPANGLSGSSRPTGIDPWALANKTLELAHANGRIIELEELVAYRDARIVELEENLARARRKLEDMEQRSRPVTRPAVPAAAVAPAPGRASTPNPSAPSSPVEVKAPAAPASAGDASVVRARSASLDPSSLNPSSLNPGSLDPGSLDPGSLARGNGHIDADREGEEDGERDSGFGLSDDAPSVRHGSGDDDLQQISGIGPRFEAALRKQGVTRLSQIAAWSEADVRQVAKALKIPKSRIVKGRWVEVAREVIGTRAASE